jgi:hypothetical protein
MRRVGLQALIVVTLLGAALLPATAEARFWVGARGDYFSGSSDLFTEFENDFGFGLEVGLGFGRFTMAAEALIMAEGQYLFDLNLGAEWLFDEGVRLGVGLFTGPILFLFSEDEAEGADFSGLSPSQARALLDATGLSSLAQAEAEFDRATRQEDDLGRLGFGWNVLRLRLSADVPLGPLYVGVAGQLGYHLLISGEDVAAGLKNRAVDEYAERYRLPSSVVSSVREAVGARPVDTDSLHGVNWDANVYVRFEF